MSSNAPIGLSWEKALRWKIAFLCMAAVAGKEGDLRILTDDLVEFCRKSSGADKPGEPDKGRG